MENLKTMEGKIKAILKKDEETRDDDMLLYLKVCNAYLKGAGAIVQQLSLLHKGHCYSCEPS